MAEKVAGSEEQFVENMNARAKKLGMNNTTFQNCNGLDTEGHMTTARDIALMSRALIVIHPEVFDYTRIWMENITHTTAKGSSEFGLTNTNKLMKQYGYATGLKTGSTSKAKFCVSATANKEGLELIAVIMAAPDPKTRFRDAITLLDYGFGCCQKYQDTKKYQFKDINIQNGVEDTVTGIVPSEFTYVDTKKRDLGKVKANPTFDKSLQAPIKKGQKLGKLVYSIDGEKLGSIDIVSQVSVKKMDFLSAIKKASACIFL